jgi:phosphoglycolate phosphatase-like HAD superfamily hydrolase
VAPTAVLWDFGDTLADERWMRRCPRGRPDWDEAWALTMADLADDWNVGAVGSPTVFEALADRTGLSKSEVETHARECCERITFHSTAWRVARERRLPQGLVTVNPDLFADFVVPLHALADVFDVIVVSFEERTADKPTLCDTALDRLGYTGSRSSALLIDNRIDLVEAWRGVGGAAYCFQSDRQFSQDVPSLFSGARGGG